MTGVSMETRPDRRLVGWLARRLQEPLPASYLVIVTAIDTPWPAELIWITACALPFVASKWAL